MIGVELPAPGKSVFQTMFSVAFQVRGSPFAALVAVPSLPRKPRQSESLSCPRAVLAMRPSAKMSANLFTDSIGGNLRCCPQLGSKPLPQTDARCSSEVRRKHGHDGDRHDEHHQKNRRYPPWSGR